MSNRTSIPVWVLIRYGGAGWWVLGLLVALAAIEVLDWFFPAMMNSFPFRWLGYGVIIAFMCTAPGHTERRAIRRSLAARLCPKCGYDLRATFDPAHSEVAQCPECGSVWTVGQ